MQTVHGKYKIYNNLYQVFKIKNWVIKMDLYWIKYCTFNSRLVYRLVIVKNGNKWRINLLLKY